LNSFQIFLLVILSFIVLNTLNVYFITSSKLNRYIVPFKRNIIGEINSIFGNMGTLFLFLSIGFLTTPNLFILLIFLLIITFVINLFFFGSSIFSLYFGNIFSKSAFDIFKNPAEGITKGLFKEIMIELFKYYRILLFIPFFVLFSFFFLFGSDKLISIPVSFNFSVYIFYIFIAFFMLIFSYLIYLKIFKKELPLSESQFTHAVQNYGIYPYFIMHLFNLNFKPNILNFFLVNKKNKIFPLISSANKNKPEYTNFFTKEKYSNKLQLKQLNDNIKIDKSLIKSDNLHGILEGKNLILIQIESLSSFIFELESLSAKIPFLKDLIKESLYFENFYSSVGIGVSSDAEVSVLTGLYPTGCDCFYWRGFDQKKKEYKVIPNLTTLPKYLKKKAYKTLAIHGDQEFFYNRNHAYEKIIRFDDFYSLKRFDNLTVHKNSNSKRLYEFEYLPNKYHVSPWTSDYQLFEKVSELSKNFSTQKHMLFPITMMPHIPFEFNPNPIKLEKEKNKFKNVTNKYLNFIDYYDKTIKRLFINRFGGNITNSNNVYLFYGDHGCGIKNGDISKLYGKNSKKDPLFERKILQKIGCFLYVPGDIIDEKTNLKKGLITGKQTLVRGQIDIYRSIIELFNLNVGNDFYMGTHLFSREKTFVLDNKLLDVVTDDDFFSLRSLKSLSKNNEKINKELIHIIKNNKIINDLFHVDEKLQEKFNLKQNKKTTKK